MCGCERVGSGRKEGRDVKFDRSESAAEHLVDLEAVLEKTRGAGMKLKLAKCMFGKRSVEFLGHRVSHGLVRPSDDHTAVFENFKEPRNASELLRFIGLVIFFGEHVESAADRLAPLYEVFVETGWNGEKSKKQKIVVADWAERWKKLQVRPFEAMREILAHPDFLVAPRPLATTKLVTDASMYGLDAVLLQREGDDAGWFPVAFTSRKQKGAEARYTVTEKECLAVLFGLQKFRQHLYGERFDVVTDHSALVWLMSLQDPKLRLARWILEFQFSDFAVKHAPGNESIMVIPDAFSRDTMNKDLTLCARCLETVGSVGSVEEELTQVDVLRCADLSVQRVTEEQ
jgi:RNase H-like domain found in reverse transcriptase